MSAVRSCLAATDTVSTLLFSMVVEPLTVTPNSTVLSPANAFDGTFTVAVSDASLLELCLLFTVTEDCEKEICHPSGRSIVVRENVSRPLPRFSTVRVTESEVPGSTLDSFEVLRVSLASWTCPMVTVRVCSQPIPWLERPCILISICEPASTESSGVIEKVNVWLSSEFPGFANNADLGLSNSTHPLMSVPGDWA